MEWENFFTKALVKYADDANIFILNLAIKFFKNININKHTISSIRTK